MNKVIRGAMKSKVLSVVCINDQVHLEIENSWPNGSFRESLVLSMRDAGAIADTVSHWRKAKEDKELAHATSTS